MRQQASTTDVVTEKSELRFQRCTWCGSAQPRPGLICRVCRSESFRWEISAGVGRVVSSNAARKPVAPTRLTTVQLDEGPLIDGWVMGGPHDQLWTGARVRFSNPAEDGSGRPVFELALEGYETVRAGTGGSPVPNRHTGPRYRGA